MRLLAASVAAVAALVGAGQALAGTYYVSPAGSDAASGSASAPWKTVSHVSSAALAPGDTVLFQGGSTYTGLLMVPASGGAGAPITFGSYGTGSANLSGGIDLNGASHVTIDALTVDTGNWQTATSTRGVYSPAGGSGSQDVTIRNSTFANVALGLLIANHADRDWLVSNNTIKSTGDSGILIYDPTRSDELGGDSMTFDSNTIVDTGLNPAITYNKHGAYDIGTNIVWRNNTIQRFQAAGLSIRAAGNTVVGNLISNGPYPIDYSPYDSTGGTTTIAYNRLLNATGSDIEINQSGTVSNPESFVIANNTMTSSGSAAALRVVGTTGFVRVANNIVATSGGSVMRFDTPPGGGLSESHDLFQGSTSGISLGAGDLVVNPLLDASGITQAGSPAIDAGSASAVTGVPYTGDCVAAFWHYCGKSPDIGATEANTTPASPPPPPPVLALGAPSNLKLVSTTTTTVSVMWTASTDARTKSYETWISGSATHYTVKGVSATFMGLACGKSYTISLESTQASGNPSSIVTLAVKTSACAPTVRFANLRPATSAASVPLRFVVKVSATSPYGISHVAVFVDGARARSAAGYRFAMSLRPGMHRVAATATDRHGVSRTVRITVRATPAG